MDVVWQIVQCRLCDSSLLETTMTLCWEIWKSRNSVRHGGPCSYGKSIVQRALALMQEYRAATEIVHSPRPTEAVKWHPPDHPLRDRLVCTSTFSSHVFLFFFFFFFFFSSPQQLTLSTVNSAYVTIYSPTNYTFQQLFFIKNGSHNIIYTFKNYFATVFSVSVFSFSKNKLNPNTSSTS